MTILKWCDMLLKAMLKGKSESWGWGDVSTDSDVRRPSQASFIPCFLFTFTKISKFSSFSSIHIVPTIFSLLSLIKCGDPQKNPPFQPISLPSSSYLPRICYNENQVAMPKSVGDFVG